MLLLSSWEASGEVVHAVVVYEHQLTGILIIMVNWHMHVAREGGCVACHLLWSRWRRLDRMFPLCSAWLLVVVMTYVHRSCQRFVLKFEMSLIFFEMPLKFWSALQILSPHKFWHRWETITKIGEYSSLPPKMNSRSNTAYICLPL